MRIVRTLTVAILAIVAIGGAGGLSYQALMTRADMQAERLPGVAFAVNGKSMHIDCRGNGGTTIVIEAGGASWSTMWRQVQEPLATERRVCAYDRAGLGYSENASAPMTADTYVDDLHELLAAAGERPPYLLVGHSLGGYLIRHYHRRYPHDVAGMVFVDAAHPRQWDELPREAAAGVDAVVAQMAGVEWMARFGLLRLLGTPPHGLPSESQEDEVRAVLSTSRYWSAAQREFRDGVDLLPTSLRDNDRLGDLPLLVISAGRSADTYCAVDGGEGIPCAESQSAWDSLQQDLVALSDVGRQVVIDDATHAIYIDAPGDVARLIDEFANSLSGGRRADAGYR